MNCRKRREKTDELAERVVAGYSSIANAKMNYCISGDDCRWR
jgi:hypothetical protein